MAPLETIIAESSNNVLSTVADWLSILGVFITGYTAYRVWYISRAFLFAGRLPDYRREISSHCEALNLVLAGSTLDGRESAMQLALCKPVLAGIKTNAPKGIAVDAKKILIQITKSLNDRPQYITQEWLEYILRELRVLELSLSHHIKDRKITPSS